MRFRLVASLLCCLAMGVSSAAWAEKLKDIEIELGKQLNGQVATLRTPVTGKQLRFDHEGRLLEGGPEGDWSTNAQIQIQTIRVEPDVIRIDGIRVHVGYHGSNREIEQTLSDDAVRIEIAIGPGELSPAEAMEVLARIFATKKELPGGVSFEQLEAYFTSIRPEKEPDSLDYPNELALAGQPKTADRIEVKTTPPVCVHCPNPEYTEEARRAKLKGRIVLWCIVNAEGKAENIRVRTPLGKGLDQEAVKAVEKWRFRPAMRDGKPVAVHMAIEMHLSLH